MKCWLLHRIEDICIFQIGFNNNNNEQVDSKVNKEDSFREILESPSRWASMNIALRITNYLCQIPALT